MGLCYECAEMVIGAGIGWRTENFAQHEMVNNCIFSNLQWAWKHIDVNDILLLYVFTAVESEVEDNII